jgi:hypothetical protein
VLVENHVERVAQISQTLRFRVESANLLAELRLFFFQIFRFFAFSISRSGSGDSILFAFFKDFSTFGRVGNLIKKGQDRHDSFSDSFVMYSTA